MCTVCGCGEGEVRIEGAEKRVNGHHHPHEHHPHDHPGHDHGHHGHDHDHHHGEEQGVHFGQDLHFGQGAARAHAPGMSQARMVAIETDILAKNDGYARINRQRFAEAGILALNLVSSPGSGKTTLLCKTIALLGSRWPLGVIEGDQQTANDAMRIRETGAPAIQINTGKGCHLDAHMVGHAIDHLKPEPFSVLFIENVGNLVCPAAFDLGEAAKVAVLSVTEGEDKPLKYPDMFTAAELVLLNKVDLAPHCDVDLDAYERNARRVNPSVEILRVSARTGEGMEAWLGWLDARRGEALTRAREAAERRLAAISEAQVGRIPA